MTIVPVGDPAPSHIQAFVGLLQQSQPAVQDLVVHTAAASDLGGRYVLGGFGFQRSVPAPPVRRTLAEVIANARTVRAGMPKHETDPEALGEILDDMDALARERRRATSTILGDEDVAE